jgi:hypothetical protein
MSEIFDDKKLEAAIEEIGKIIREGVAKVEKLKNSQQESAISSALPPCVLCGCPAAVGAARVSCSGAECVLSQILLVPADWRKLHAPNRLTLPMKLCAEHGDVLWPLTDTAVDGRIIALFCNRDAAERNRNPITRRLLDPIPVTVEVRT